MSIVEIYNPKFDDFHGDPVVTWREGNGPVRISPNMLAQYKRWRSNKVPKNEPPAAFWNSGGPAIVRALLFCGASALVFDYTTDTKVCYRWFGARAEGASGGDWFSICPVRAHTDAFHVVVTLPTDEDIIFYFDAKQMESWLKPKKEAPP